MATELETVRENQTYIRDGANDGETYNVVNVNDYYTKDANASNWHLAVVYFANSEPDRLLVRTLPDFCQKFSIYVEKEDA